jgi:hypothetical protein
MMIYFMGVLLVLGILAFVFYQSQAGKDSGFDAQIDSLSAQLDQATSQMKQRLASAKKPTTDFDKALQEAVKDN